MRKKKLLSATIAATVVLSATLGGCSLVSSNTAADMNQVIAEVNISEATTFDKKFDDYKSTVGTSNVIKRELVAYFLNAGYSYVQSGMPYNQVFTQLLNGLVENEVLTQYATMYLMDYKATEEGKTSSQLVAEYTKFDGQEGKTEAEIQAEKYEYLLGGADSDDVKLAKYSLFSSLNSAIDSYEERIIDSDDSSSGSGTRSTPGGVDSEEDDYYPANEDGSLNYNVYTGFKGYLLTDSGAYQDDCVDGTRRNTRIRAYNDFINSLASSSYDLVDKKTENLRDILSLNYIKDEYVSQLEQRIINKYYDLYEEEQKEGLKANNYSYIEKTYNDILNLQTETYSSESSFSSALGNMSDSTFVLYAPDSSEDGTYGFVYNILLPFSASQSAQLTELQSLYKDEDLDGGYTVDYFVARNALLKNIETTDQRSAWFNGDTKYAYHKDGSDYFGNSGWLFFENNLEKNYRYKPLEKYLGAYSYNGTVLETEDDFVLIPEKLDIDDMLKEFMDYVNYATGTTAITADSINPVAGYYNLSEDNLYDKSGKEEKIDYEKFVYAYGKANITDTEAGNRANLMNKDSVQYKALSAVNELQYAYTTDTGVLSQYVGYSINAGDTDYIKEFEHAAHKAVNSGAGSWAVCAGDYGWHLIYVTYTFDNKGIAQYTPDWAANIDKEGTFENLFYEMIKTNDIKDISTTRRTQIITEYKSDSTVKKYQERYQDLLDIQNSNSNSNSNSNTNS